MIVYINKIIFLLRKHYAAIFLSLLIGLVMVAPELLFIQQAGNDYRGIHMFKTDAELHYLARMQEVVDGNGLGNPFIYEYKNNVPSAAYTISETILAWPAKFFGIPIPTINLFYKFFLPVIIALLVYSLSFRLIGNRIWSVAAMFGVLLGNALLNAPDLVHFLRWEKVYDSFALYSRPINPEFSSIIFFAYLHIFFSALKKKTWRWFLALGVLLGVSFYVYFYSYSFFLALNAVFFFLYAARKEYNISLKIATATILGAAIGAWSIVNTIAIYHHQYYLPMAKLSDIVLSHRPVVSAVGVMAALILVLFALRYRTYPNLIFLYGLVATAFVVVNQQVVTGILIQEGHYHWYFNVPIFIIIFIITGYYFLGNRRILSIVLAALVCFVSLASATLIQASAYERWVGEVKNDQRYAKVLAWLKKETPKESVVFADNSLSQFIPVYTSNNVVWENHAAYYLLSPERRAFTPEALLSAPNFRQELSQYQVDYFVWDTKKEPEWRLDKYSFLKQLYDDGEFKIYAR